MLFTEFDPFDAPIGWGHTQSHAWAAGANMVLDWVLMDEACTPEMKERIENWVRNYQKKGK